MRIYISPKYKHIVMAPFRCGSTTVECMLQTRGHWENVFLGKKIIDPSKILDDYIDPNFIIDYKKVLLVRNPFNYIISGFRFMLDQNKQHNSFCFPSLTSHLLAIKKSIVTEDRFWSNHCQHQPFDYYNSKFIVYKLEEFDKFLKYLDINCKGDYNFLSIYHENKQENIPYPAINEFEENLIIKLTKTAAKRTGYNVLKSIEIYKKRYNSGELNELFE